MSNIESDTKHESQQSEMVDLDQLEAQLAEVELMLERLDSPNNR